MGFEPSNIQFFFRNLLFLFLLIGEIYFSMILFCAKFSLRHSVQQLRDLEIRYWQVHTEDHGTANLDQRMPMRLLRDLLLVHAIDFS